MCEIIQDDRHTPAEAANNAANSHLQCIGVPQGRVQTEGSAASNTRWASQSKNGSLGSSRLLQLLFQAPREKGAVQSR